MNKLCQKCSKKVSLNKEWRLAKVNDEILRVCPGCAKSLEGKVLLVSI